MKQGGTADFQLIRPWQNSILPGTFLRDKAFKRTLHEVETCPIRKVDALLAEADIFRNGHVRARTSVHLKANATLE